MLTSYKRQDAFPNNHPNYAGNLLTSNKEAQRLAYDESDLLIVLGCRLNQQTTGGFTFPRPGQPFVQIDADEENLGQNARPEVGILADAKQTLLAALKHAGPRPNENRAAWIAEQHAKQKDFCTPQDRPTPKVSMFLAGIGHQLHGRNRDGTERQSGVDVPAARHVGSGRPAAAAERFDNPFFVHATTHAFEQMIGVMTP